MDKIQPKDNELTEEFITAHADIIDWKYVCAFADVKVLYVICENFKASVYWHIVLLNLTLNYEFFEKYFDKLNEESLIQPLDDVLEVLYCGGMLVSEHNKKKINETSEWGKKISLTGESLEAFINKGQWLNKLRKQEDEKE